MQIIDQEDLQISRRFSPSESDNTPSQGGSGNGNKATTNREPASLNRTDEVEQGYLNSSSKEQVTIKRESDSSIDLK